MEKDNFIIKSLLDLDVYKLTMAQFAWNRYQNTPVEYGFLNRTKPVPLADFINEAYLREELEHIQRLKFMPEEIQYLRESEYIKKGVFSESFLDFLSKLRLSEVRLAKGGGNYQIEPHGTWPEAVLWETLILSVATELYNQGVIWKKLPKTRCGLFGQIFHLQCELRRILEEGEKRLLRKIAILKKNRKIEFNEFGTRRRFSQVWQEHVVSILADQLPKQLVGTSNLLLAKKFNLRPIGTFAHEMYMILSGIYHGSDDDIRSSHNRVLKEWWEEYGEPLSIALTDNYGTDFFFQDFTAEQAKKWKGLRQDSGNPFEFGEKAIKFYKSKGIDPKAKLIVFSDGLDVKTILKLHKQFHRRIKVTFGWGTNLTNDLGLEPLSLVVKVTEANGHGTVKLSDNLAKAVGKPEDIERFKRIFGHTVTLNRKCTY